MPPKIRDTGEKDLPAVVFLHAFPLGAGQWDAQVAALRGRRRCVVYDQRGFGGAPPGDGPVTLELWVDDLFEVMDLLSLDKAVLCGLSMGGYVALRAVQREPSRVSGLVLADTKSEADGDEAKIKRAGAIKAVKRDGLERFIASFLPTALAPGAEQSAVRAARDLCLANDPRGVQAALLALAARTDTTAGLAAIKVPTLVIIGEKDALTPPAHSEALARAIPGASLEIIAGAGHFSNLERPEEFNRALAGFLSARLERKI